MRTTLNINAAWHFIKDCPTLPAGIPEGAVTVDLPHTWNALDGQDGGNDYFRGTCCYLKTIAKADLPACERVYLELCGANSSADVYCNGKHLAHHDGGYSTWRVDLTNCLTDELQLAVLVDNAPNDRVYPQTADFTFYGGLYRNVNLICTADTHFELMHFGGSGLYVTPVMEGANAKVSIRTELAHSRGNEQVRCTISDAEGNIVAQGNSGDFLIENAHLWDGTKNPYLYTAKAELLRDGTVLDTVTTGFGCRSFEIHPEKGFILNGREYPLRGVSRHQDRWEIGNALLPAHHEEDMALIAEMGANTIRLAHYQHDQYFYDLCDKYGMVVWAEIPYISRHMPEGNENTLTQMQELVLQNYNHPSIVVWGLSNEITMGGAKDPDLLKNHQVLNDLVHTLDKTRPTVIACLSMCGMDEKYVHIPDVVSYNHYFGWYGGDVHEYGPWFDKFHSKYPNTPIGCSEYGCEALNWHNSRPDAGDYSEEYQAYYHEELIKQLFPRKYLWATHVWNMFDFGADARGEGGENGQNHKGLVTIDRKYKKDSFYAYKAWLSDEPFVHLCGKRYIDRVEDVTKVTVYSNLPTVELFANGVSLGTKTAEDHFFKFDVPNVGETTLEAVAGECRDTSTLRKVDEMNPDYILREAGAVLNWFDITEVEGRFSLNSKLGDILNTFRGKLWGARTAVLLIKKMRANKREKSDGGFPLDSLGGMLNMLSGMTVLRLSSMASMVNISFTKEELLDMNRRLIKIKSK